MMHKTTQILSFLLVAACVLCVCSAHATTYYWIGGAAGNWNDGSNWSLTDGGAEAGTYPDADKGTTNSGSDTAVFSYPTEITVTVPTTQSYFAFRNLTLNTTVALTGGGELRSGGKSNNSGSEYVISGDSNGKLCLKGIMLRSAYGTKKETKARISVPVEVAEGTCNVIAMSCNDSRFGNLELSGALSGSGSLTINAASPSSVTITSTPDTSSFNGVLTNQAYVGTFNIGGGTFVAANATAVPQTIVFSGGTLKTVAGVATDIASRIGASSTSIMFDAEENDFTWSSIAAMAASFTKRGQGVLTLAQSPRYTGVTTVSQGTLVLPLGHAFPDSVVVEEGAYVRFVGNPTWADGSEQTLCTFASGKVPDSATLARFVVTGLAPRQSYVCDVTSGSLVATISSPALTWNGTNEATWSGSGNWLIGTETVATFQSGDKVQFTDADFTAQSATELSVTVDGNVDPSVVSVSPGEGNTYTFVGAGKATTDDLVISKSGAGTMKLSADVFGGKVVSNDGGGTVEIASDVTLAHMATSASDFSGYDYVSRTIIDNGSTLTFSGDANYGQIDNQTFAINGKLVFDGSGADRELRSYYSGTGDIVLTNNASYRGGYYSNAGISLSGKYYGKDFTGGFYLYEGTVLKLFFRNLSFQKNYFGGVYHLAGGTIKFPNNNTASAYLYDLVVEDGTTSTIDCSSTSHTTYIDQSGSMTGSGTLNVNLDTKGIRMKANASGFSGTVNFWGIKVQNDASGILHSQAGSAKGVYNVMVKPENYGTAYSGYLDVFPTKWVHFEMESANKTLNLGALNVANSNMVVYCKNPFTLALGGETNANSTIEGKFGLQNAGAYAITKAGTGTLTLGKSFVMEDWDVITNSTLTAREYTKTIAVNAGTLINNADLTGISVAVADGAKIGGVGTFSSDGLTFAGNYTITTGVDDKAVTLPDVVDFTDNASLEVDLTGIDASDPTKTYKVLTASSIHGKPSKSSLAALNEGQTKGEWKFQVENGSLVIKFAKNSFALILR